MESLGQVHEYVGQKQQQNITKVLQSAYLWGLTMFFLLHIHIAFDCTYVWWLAGRRVTLHTRYFLFIWPQWVTSTFKPVQQTRKYGLIKWWGARVFSHQLKFQIYILKCWNSVVFCSSTDIFRQDEDKCWQGSQLRRGFFTALCSFLSDICHNLVKQTQRRMDKAYKCLP